MAKRGKKGCGSKLVPLLLVLLLLVAVILTLHFLKVDFGEVCKWIGVALLGLVVLVVLWLLFIKYVFLPFLSPQSIRFLGEVRSFDKTVDAAFGCPYSSYMPALLQYLFSSGVEDDKPVETLQDMDDQSLIGPAAACAQYHKRGDPAKEHYFRGRAEGLLAEHPAKNEGIKRLITEAGRTAKYHLVTINEHAWALEASAEANHTEAEMPSATLFVRLGRDAGGYDGDLVMIGPIMGLPDWVIREINALGEIKHIVTPAMFHTGHTTFAAQKWPKARLIGSDSKGQHGDVTLPWVEFTDQMRLKPDGTNTQLFGDDLYFLRCDGHVFQEPIFFHRTSRTIFTTDLMIRGMHGSNLYSAALGLFRGPHEKDAHAQNHHQFWMNNPPLYAKRVKRVIALAEEMSKDGREPILVLGHAGIFGGEGEAIAQLRNGFGFANPTQASLKWLYKLRIFYYLFILPSYLLGMGMFGVVSSLGVQMLIHNFLPARTGPDPRFSPHYPFKCSSCCNPPRPHRVQEGHAEEQCREGEWSLDEAV